MNVDDKIMAALTPFGDPVYRAVYQGEEKRYYTFSYDTIPANYADDEPQCERCLVQVHLFAPLDGGNLLSRIAQTKRALANEGFLYPQTQDDSDESGRHIVFETEIAQGVDDGDV